MTASEAYRVLVVGYRAGLKAALEERGISYALWDGRAHPTSKAHPALVLPLQELRLDTLRDHAKQFLSYGPFTHVIACTEKAVLPAAIARRVLGARLSQQSTIIRCFDKLLMKEELSRCGVAMTAFVRPRKQLSSEAIVDQLGKPVVLKDRASSGGRSIHFAATVAEVEAHRKGPRIAERYINAPEMSVESFIQEGKILFTNITNYLVKKHINILPASLPAADMQHLLALNAKVISCLQIRWGMTHMECYRTPEGFLFGEIALRPPGGYIMELITQAYGFTSWQAFLSIELGESFSFPSKPRHHACVSIIHPGPGRVEAITGLDTLAALATMIKIKLKLEVGQQLRSREGVGEDYGYYMQRSASYEDLVAACHHAESCLTITLAPS